MFVIPYQIIEMVEDEGSNWIKSDYDKDSFISKGFNYVQVEVRKGERRRVMHIAIK